MPNGVLNLDFKTASVIPVRIISLNEFFPDTLGTENFLSEIYTFFDQFDGFRICIASSNSFRGKVTDGDAWPPSRRLPPKRIDSHEILEMYPCIVPRPKCSIDKD